MRQFFAWLGRKDCKKGVPARSKNIYYLWAYALQYEWEQIQEYKSRISHE